MPLLHGQADRARPEGPDAGASRKTDAGIGDPVGTSLALGSRVLDVRALHARWRLGDGSRWELALNLSDHAVALPGDAATEVAWCEPAAAWRPGERRLDAHALVALAQAGE